MQKHFLRGFWKTIKKPCFVLAPLYDVTDAPFRKIISTYGKPDVMFTEFISSDGICSLNKRSPSDHCWTVRQKLIYSPTERPVVAQLFGSDPQKYKGAVAHIKELGFDGVDINMGCPEKNVIKCGAGSGLIKTPALAQEIISACKEAGGSDFAVSVKTRIGFDTLDVFDDWIGSILDAEPDALTLHLRTMKEMSLVDAHWNDGFLEKALKIRRDKNKSTLIIGNGDIKNLEEARNKVETHGIDGVMIGRGIFGKPWLWTEQEPSLSDQIEILQHHLVTFHEIFQGQKYHIMKKHFQAYLTGFPHVSQYRVRLLESNTLEEGLVILDEIRRISSII